MRFGHQGVGGIVLLVLVMLAGCHVRRSSGLSRLERDLRPKLVLDRAVAQRGDEISSTYTVTNVGQDTRVLCFGGSFMIAVHDRESLHDIDHPFCVSPPVRLGSGQSASTRLVFTVPDLAAGATTVSGAVEVVDPTRCRAVGCPRTFLEVEAEAPLTIEK